MTETYKEQPSPRTRAAMDREDDAARARQIEAGSIDNSLGINPDEVAKRTAEAIKNNKPIVLPPLTAAELEEQRRARCNYPAVNPQPISDPVLDRAHPSVQAQFGYTPPDLTRNVRTAVPVADPYPPSHPYHGMSEELLQRMGYKDKPQEDKPQTSEEQAAAQRAASQRCMEHLRSMSN